MGDEPTSRSKVLSATVDEILGDQDRSLALDSFDMSDAADDESLSRMIEDAVH